MTAPMNAPGVGGGSACPRSLHTRDDHTARRGAWAAHLNASWRSASVTCGALLGAFAGLLLALLAQVTHPLGVALLTAAGGH